MEHRLAVLCEKPAVLHPSEMKQIIYSAAASQTLFMEAMKTRFVPTYRQLRQLIQDGAIGELQKVEVSLCNDFGPLHLPVSHWHHDAQQGGSLLDGGCYELNYLLDFLGTDYQIDSWEAVYGPNHVDYYVKAHLLFDTDGRQTEAVLESAMDRSRPKEAILYGSLGTIRLDNLHRPSLIHIDTASGQEKLEFPYEINDMYSELNAFYQAWNTRQTECSVMSWNQSLHQVQLLEDLIAAVRPEYINSLK